MPRFRRGRPLKRWRYVGAYGREVMACVCDVRIAGVPQRWWAVAERGRPVLARTTTRAGGVAMDGARATVAAGGVRIELEVDEDGGVETVHPSGRSGYVWTRKQAGVPRRGSVEIRGPRRRLHAPGGGGGTPGHHPRRATRRRGAGAARAP